MATEYTLEQLVRIAKNLHITSPFEVVPFARGKPVLFFDNKGSPSGGVAEIKKSVEENSRWAGYSTEYRKGGYERAVWTAEGKVYDYLNRKMYATVKEWARDNDAKYGHPAMKATNRSTHEETRLDSCISLYQLKSRLEEAIGCITLEESEAIANDTLVNLLQRVNKKGQKVRYGISAAIRKAYIMKDSAFVQHWIDSKTRISLLGDPATIFVETHNAPVQNCNGMVSVKFLIDYLNAPVEPTALIAPVINSDSGSDGGSDGDSDCD